MVPLSPRQTTVLRLIDQGYTLREIAAQLGLSEKTITTHKARLMAKLWRAEAIDGRTTADLVAYARQRAREEVDGT